MANEVYKDDANLKGLWLMEETSGTRFDSSQNSNDLTDNNTVGSSTDSKEGVRSADFEATNFESLSITDAAQSGLVLQLPFSIAFWWKPESLPAAVQGILEKDDDYEVFYNQNVSTMRLRVRSSSVFTSLDASTSPVVAQWDHWCVVADGVDVRWYLNGSLDNNAGAYTSTLDNNGLDFRIGRRGGNYLDGLLDEVAIFNRALSVAEVAAIHSKGILEPGPLVGGKLVGGGILQGRLVR